MVWSESLSETCILEQVSESAPWISLKMNHICNNIQVRPWLYEWQRCPWVIIMHFTSKLAYDTQHWKKITRITSKNIIPGHIRILEILHNFENTDSNKIHLYNRMWKFIITYLTMFFMQFSIPNKLSLISFLYKGSNIFEVFWAPLKNL